MDEELGRTLLRLNRLVDVGTFIVPQVMACSAGTTVLVTIRQAVCAPVPANVRDPDKGYEEQDGEEHLLPPVQ
jgi:hypothetical protein